MAVRAHEQPFIQPSNRTEAKKHSREFGKIALELFSQLQELGEIDAKDFYRYATGVFDLMSTSHSQGDILRVTLKTGKITSYRWIALFPDGNNAHLYVPTFGTFDPIAENFTFISKKTSVQEIQYSEEAFNISQTAQVLTPLGIPQGSTILSIELFPGLAKDANTQIEKSRRTIADKITDFTTPSEDELNKDPHEIFVGDVKGIVHTIRKLFSNRR